MEGAPVALHAERPNADELVAHLSRNPGRRQEASLDFFDRFVAAHGNTWLSLSFGRKLVVRHRLGMPRGYPRASRLQWWPHPSSDLAISRGRGNELIQLAESAWQK